MGDDGVVGGGMVQVAATPGTLVATGMPGSLVQVDSWRRAGIAILEGAADDETRIAVRDAALRVKQAAEVVDDGERQVAAAEVVQRCNRSIGQAHGAGRERDKGGRPRKDENCPTGRTVSRQTVGDYRADAEAVSDQGFETVAVAARDAGRPLDRRTVREAGRIEAGGGDPGEAVRAPQPKVAPRDVVLIPPAPLLDAARRAVGVDVFDLAPASCQVANRFVKARFCLGPDRGAAEPWTPPGESDDWAGTLFVHPPPGREEPFAERLARMVEANWDGVAVWLSDAATSAPWAQRVIPRAWVVAFPAGEMVFCDGSGSVAGETRRRGPQMVLVVGAMDEHAIARAFHALSPLGAVLDVNDDPDDPDDDTGEDPDAG